MLKEIIPSLMNPPLAPVLVTDEAGLERVSEFLRRTFVLGFDLETNLTPSFYDRRIRIIQLGDRNEQFVIDLLPFAQRAGVHLHDTQAIDNGVRFHPCLAPVVDCLRPMLFSHLWEKVGHNLQFEYETLKWNLGIRSYHFYDTFLAEKIRYAGDVHFKVSGFWALSDVVGRYTGLEMKKDEQKGFDLETPLRDAQVVYCALDVRLPMSARAPQMLFLEKNKLSRAAQIEFDAIPAFGDMHLNGLLIDTERWLKLVRLTEQRQKKIVERLDAWFIPYVGSKHITAADKARLIELEEVWRKSPSKTPEDKTARAVARRMYMSLRTSLNARTKDAKKCEGDAFINYASNIQVKKELNKTGKYNLTDTNDTTLEQLCEFPKLELDKAFEEDPTLEKFKIIDLLRLHRSTDKQRSTYGYAWVRTEEEDGHVYKFTGRIHSNIDQLGAATGRTTSNSPNVQNIPRDSEFRFCFISRVGYKMLTVDMSGAELRILAEMSGEPVWLDAFSKGWDVHSVCGEIIFGKEWADATEVGCLFVDTKQKCKCKGHKKLREIAKTLNFGLAYGMGPKKLADGVGITEKEAKIVFEKFKKSFPTVFAYLELSGKRALETLQSRTLSGRVRLWKRPSMEDAKKRLSKDLKKGEVSTQSQIIKKLRAMCGAIEREGKNTPIQGSNADFIKLCMGCGFDSNGKPYLWHILEPEFGALLNNCVHDELVVEALDAVAQPTFAAIGDAMTRASAEFLTKVTMTTEGKIDTKWSK